MMKLQDVLLKAMAKKISWADAGEIIGVTDRTMRRWRERLEEHGYDGLADRRKGRPSPKRVPLKVCEEVLRLYQERYADFNVRHFHEKLREEHGIELSYTWVKRALQGAGLVKRCKRRGVHRRRRARRPLPGMLLHIDGSQHQWFQDERWYDLVVILDDATSEIYYAQLVEEEATRTVMAALWEVVETQGLFLCAVQRPGRAFLPDAESWRSGRQVPADAGGPGAARTGHPDDSGLFRRRRGAGANGALGRGKGGCRRNCGWPGSSRWRGPTSFCAIAISPSSTANSRFRQRKRAAPSAPVADGTWNGSSQCRISGWWPRITRHPAGAGLAVGAEPLALHSGGLHGDHPRALERDGLGCATAPIWWDASRPTGRR